MILPAPETLNLDLSQGVLVAREALEPLLDRLPQGEWFLLLPLDEDSLTDFCRERDDLTLLEQPDGTGAWLLMPTD